MSLNFSLTFSGATLLPYNVIELFTYFFGSNTSSTQLAALSLSVAHGIASKNLNTRFFTTFGAAFISSGVVCLLFVVCLSFVVFVFLERVGCSKRCDLHNTNAAKILNGLLDLQLCSVCELVLFSVVKSQNTGEIYLPSLLSHVVV
jgi:hypothetical protein